jgi:hypothetical protein
VVSFPLNGWGAPGTAAYQTYEYQNRLMAFSLLLMAAGWLGLARSSPGGYGRWGAWLALVGAILMITGNAAEFWLYSDLSYDCCNMRHIAWETFLTGLFITVIGATVSGLAFQRTRSMPPWVRIMLILALPLVVTSFMLSPFLGPAVLAVILGSLLLSVRLPQSLDKHAQDV